MGCVLPSWRLRMARKVRWCRFCGARTPACRVGNRADAWPLRITQTRSHECERCTQECVRYGCSLHTDIVCLVPDATVVTKSPSEGSAMRFVLVCAIWLAFCLPAPAHHSGAAEFDSHKKVDLTGVVTNVEWTNPHAH